MVAGSRQVPPSWVEAFGVGTGGYWVNRPDMCFAVELDDWAPGEITLPALQGTRGSQQSSLEDGPAEHPQGSDGKPKFLLAPYENR